MQAPLKDYLAPYILPSTCLSVNLEECHAPKIHFVASSTKRNRTCLMASLDINNLSKIEIRILSAVCSNVIYVLSSHVSKILICVSSIPCKISLLYLLKVLNERDLVVSGIKGNEHICFVWRLGAGGSNTRQKLAESTNLNL